MSEYVFNLVDANKRNFQAKFNDIIFDYAGYRNVFPENVCIEILNSIKEKSGKKIAIIFGNCQTEKLQNFLLNNIFFAEKYFIIKLPMVCTYSDKLLGYFQEKFWSLCDLFISQRISNDNRFNPILATQKIPSFLPEDAKIIWIPNVYFDGYFPQYAKNFCEVDTYRFRNGGLFPSGDKYVDAYLDGGGAAGRQISELVEYIKAQNFISKEEVLAGVEKSFEELKKREWACDIHMLDFVVDNYKRQQIFYSPNHPTQNVLLELSRRILKFMDISDTSFKNTDWLMSENQSLIGQDVPIYPKVKKILCLKDSLNIFYANRHAPWNFRADYVEFLVTYAKICWKEKLKP